MTRVICKQGAQQAFIALACAFILLIGAAPAAFAAQVDATAPVAETSSASATSAAAVSSQAAAPVTEASAPAAQPMACKAQATQSAAAKPAEPAASEACAATPKVVKDTGKAAAKEAADVAAATTAAREAAVANSAALAAATKTPAATKAAAGDDALTPAASTLVNNGIYTIAPRASRTRSVEIASGSTDNGARAQVYQDNCTLSQRWRFHAVGGGYYEIINLNSDKVLEVKDGIARKGAWVQQHVSNGSDAQRWRIEDLGKGRYQLRSALADSFAISLAKDATVNGTKLVLYRAKGTATQTWNLTQITRTVANGTYALTNGASEKALDVASGSFADGTNVQQWSANDTLAQTFAFTWEKKTGYYIITCVSSGKVLDVASSSWDVGANVQQWTSNGTLAQRWAVSLTAEGSLLIRSALGGQALEVEYASDADGANVRLWTANGSVAQTWTATKTVAKPVPGTYFITHLYSGNVMGIAKTGVSVRSQMNTGSNEQRWTLIKKGKNTFVIKNPVTGMFLSTTALTTGATLRAGTVKQRWTISFSRTGFVLSPVGSGNRVIAVAGNSTASEAKLKLVAKSISAAQRFGFESTVEEVSAAAIVNVARQYIGVVEGSDIHKFIIDTYNAHTDGYDLSYYDSWCAAFVSFCSMQAGTVSATGTECSCGRWVDIMQAKGIWHEDGTLTPQPGWIILYNWDSISQPNDGWPDHIGIVESVVNGVITTIEGNTSDMVTRRILPVGDGNIRGYATPRYNV